MQNSADPEDKYKEAKARRKGCVENILNSRSRKKIVVAGPGTGKTYLFKEVLGNKANLLTLTFINSLVDDLSIELNGLSEVRTLHGFARSILSRLLKREVKIFPRLSKVIQQDASILMGKEIDFDKIFHNRDDENQHIEFYRKRKTYYDNYYGYSDIVFAAVKYFESNPDKVPEYDQVVVDEFQDFNKLEVSLIDLLASKNPVLLVGDDDQALYPFKSASPEHIRRRQCDSNLEYESFNLPFCSRCTRVIVEAANDIIEAARKAGFLNNRVPKPFEYFEEREKDTASDTNRKILYSQKFYRQIPWFIEEQVNKILKDVQCKFSVLIISPTKTQARLISEALKGKGFENVEYLERRGEDLNLLDGLKILLEDDKSNLGWRIVSGFLLNETELKCLLIETNKNNTKNIHEIVGANCRTRAKEMIKILKKIQDNKFIDENSLQIVKQIGFDPCEMIKEALKRELITGSQKIGSHGIRKIAMKVTTIASSKGLDEDYVFITHFDDRYFIRNKNKTISDHDICSFLVALTRARKKVFLVSSQNKEPIFLNWIKEERIERV